MATTGVSRISAPLYLGTSGVSDNHFKRLYKSAQRMELADFHDFYALVQGGRHNTGDNLQAMHNFLTKSQTQYAGN